VDTRLKSGKIEEALKEKEVKGLSMATKKLM
jgi:hypothetical protein